VRLCLSCANGATERDRGGFTGNLLAKAATRDLNHDFALPGAQRAEALLERNNGLLALPPGAIASQAQLNGVQDDRETAWPGTRSRPPSACTVIGISPCPVMNMIGSFLWAAARSRWRSRPLCPGNLTSRTRQVGASVGLDLAKSGMEANTRVSMSSDRNKRAIETRKSGSSSITRTVGLASVMAFAPRSMDGGDGPFRHRPSIKLPVIVRLEIAARA
jgi:hypothetical protein